MKERRYHPSSGSCQPRPEVGQDHSMLQSILIILRLPLYLRFQTAIAEITTAGIGTSHVGPSP